jgi:hypothetical protein
MLSWTLFTQNYSRNHFGDPRPPVERQYFRTEAEAAAALRAFRTAYPDTNIYIAGVTAPRRRKSPMAERQADFGFALADGPRRVTG